MLASLFLIGTFLLAFRWFAPGTSWQTAAGIPCVVLAGLFAMNFFEPAAQVFATSTRAIPFLSSEADFICFLGLFLGTLALLRKLVCAIANPVHLTEWFEFRARLLLTIAASYLVMAITLTACDTSPRLQWLLGLSPNSAAFLGIIAPDAQWLSLVDFVADGALSRPKPLAPLSETESTPAESASAEGSARTLRRRFGPH